MSHPGLAAVLTQAASDPDFRQKVVAGEADLESFSLNREETAILKRLTGDKGATLDAITELVTPAAGAGAWYWYNPGLAVAPATGGPIRSLGEDDVGRPVIARTPYGMDIIK